MRTSRHPWSLYSMKILKKYPMTMGGIHQLGNWLKARKTYLLKQVWEWIYLRHAPPKVRSAFTDMFIHDLSAFKGGVGAHYTCRRISITVFVKSLLPSASSKKFWTIINKQRWLSADQSVFTLCALATISTFEIWLYPFIRIPSSSPPSLRWGQGAGWRLWRKVFGVDREILTQ